MKWTAPFILAACMLVSTSPAMGASGAKERQDLRDATTVEETVQDQPINWDDPVSYPLAASDWDRLVAEASRLAPISDPGVGRKESKKVRALAGMELDTSTGPSDLAVGRRYFPQFANEVQQRCAGRMLKGGKVPRDIVVLVLRANPITALPDCGSKDTAP